MSIPIEFDDRYVVTQEMVDKFREVRRTEGISYQKIADRFGVSYFTVYYWCNDGYRKEKQAINSKRRYADRSQQIARQVNKRRVLWKTLPTQRLLDYLYSAKTEKRSNRHTVMGVPIRQLEDELQNFKTGGQKVS